MTEQQKSVIKTLRQQNFSYNAIANTLGLTISTVKSYCQRNGLAGNRKEAFRSNPLKNSHLEQVKRRNPHTVNCLCCGKEFTYYGPNPQKFCSHPCYIKHRYEGVTYVAETV